MSGKKRKLSFDVDALQCPVCWETISAPIFQCNGGHLICGPCHRELTHCPTCRDKLAGGRNYALERMLGHAALPCAYQEAGCPEDVPYASREQHEAACKFRPLPCPMPGVACPWVGTWGDIVAHLTEKHDKKVEALSSPTSTVSFDFLATDDFGTLGDGDRWLSFYQFRQQLFVLTLYFKAGRFHCYLNSVTDLPDALYEVAVRSGPRQMAWRAPIVCSQSEEARLRTSDCLVLCEEHIKTFAERDRPTLGGDRPVVAWRFHGTIMLERSPSSAAPR